MGPPAPLPRKRKSSRVPQPLPYKHNLRPADQISSNDLNSSKEQKTKRVLSDFQSMLCGSQVRGFDLREKEWGTLSCSTSVVFID
jgi:hypothetical protein